MLRKWKKIDLVSDLKLLSKDRDLSNVTPRFLKLGCTADDKGPMFCMIRGIALSGAIILISTLISLIWVQL